MSNNFNVVDLNNNQATNIVTLYDDNSDLIEKYEEQLNFQPTIIGEAKKEESTKFDIDLFGTVHFGVTTGTKLIGYISASLLERRYSEYFPDPRPKNNSNFPDNFRSYYITNLTPRIIEKNNTITYDTVVLELLIKELIKTANNVDGIVINLPENLPVYLFEFFKCMKFKGVGINPKFFNRKIDSVFMAYQKDNK